MRAPYLAMATAMTLVLAVGLPAGCEGGGGGSGDDGGGPDGAGPDAHDLPCVCDAGWPVLEGTWNLHLSVDQADPCPDFVMNETVNLVWDGVAVTSADPDVQVESFDVRPAEEATAQVVIIDSWTESGTGTPVSPRIELDLQVSNVGGGPYGTATTSFPWDTGTGGTTCSYTFFVNGYVTTP